MKFLNSNLTEIGNFVSANGAYLIDPGGVEYLDTWLGAGTLLGGHNHPNLGLGRTSFDMLLPDRSDLAESIKPLIRRMVDFEIGGCGFQTSGSSAVSRAMRVARAATGKKKVAVVGNFWHGSDDYTLFTNAKTPIGKGVSTAAQEDIIYFNSLSEFMHSRQLEKFAAILLEPFQGSNPQKSTLDLLTSKDQRDLLREKNVLVIADEVITGFRERYGSCNASRASAPDICIFGKALGHGYPASLVLVERETFEKIQGSIFWGGTLAGSLPQLDRIHRCLSFYSELEYKTVHNNLRTVSQHIGKALACEQSEWEVCTGPLFSRIVLRNSNVSSREFISSGKDRGVEHFQKILHSHKIYVGRNGLVFSSILDLKEFKIG